MNEPDINNHLSDQNLFGLFSLQLKKDFEGAGLSTAFMDGLPAGFCDLSEVIAEELGKILGNNPSALPGLLYRVDISEGQLKKYASDQHIPFEVQLAELVIKRILQKIILRKTFSK